MKRILVILVLLRICALTALPAASKPLIQSLDFLIVVDTSFSMSRLDDQVMAWVHDLVASGFGGHIKPNQSYSIWTFNEKVSTRLFSTKVWSPELNRLLAADSVRFLKIQRYEKQTFLSKAIQEMKDALAAHPDLVVFLISDGKERMQGTPFDQQITAACLETVPRIGRSRRPIMVTLVAREGQFVAWNLTLAGNPVQFPDVSFLEERKDRQAISSAPEISPTVKPAEVASTNVTSQIALPVPAPTSTLTSAAGSKPTETKLESPVTASPVPAEPASAAPAPQQSTSSPSVPPPPPAISQAEQPSVNRTVVEENPRTSSVTQPASLADTPPPVADPAPSLDSSSHTPVDAAKTTGAALNIPTTDPSVIPPTPSANIQPKLDQEASAALAAPSTASESGEPATATARALPAPAESTTRPSPLSSQGSSPPAPNALLTPFPDRTGGRSSVMLVVGVVFLLSAGLVFWMYRQKSRGPRLPSLISQSLDRKP